MAGLYGPYLKIKRAKEHLDLLNRKVSRFEKSKCYRVRRKKDVKAGEYLVTITMVDVPLDPLSLIAGDFIGCLRSSLDHLAFRLAIKNNQLPKHKVSFPICDGPQPNAKFRRFIESSTKGMPQGAVNIIESFQPYHARDRYKCSYLWQLNHLWNVDKHRHLTFHSGMVELKFAEIPRSANPIRQLRLDNGGVMVFPLSVILQQNVKLKPKPLVQLRFGDEREKLMLTMQELVDIYEFVSDKLMPRFSRFLQ